MIGSPWTNEEDLKPRQEITSIKITSEKALSMWKEANEQFLPRKEQTDADIAADQIIEEINKLRIAIIGLAPMASLLRNKNNRYGVLQVGAVTLTELDKVLAATDHLEGEELKKAIPEPY